jgi:ABC-type multidrug transport system permease subunit
MSTNANPAEYMLEAIGAGSLGIQINMVVRRNFTAYYRDPNYMAGKFILHILTGLFNTFTFYHAGNEIIDMQSRLFSVFLTVAAAPPLMQQLQPKFVNYRQIYLSREAGSKIYSWVAYTIAAVLVDYSILAGTIYYACWWWAASGKLDCFGERLCVAASHVVRALRQLRPSHCRSCSNENLASVLIPVFYIFCIAFCGVLVPRSFHTWRPGCIT